MSVPETLFGQFSVALECLEMPLAGHKVLGFGGLERRDIPGRCVVPAPNDAIASNANSTKRYGSKPVLESLLSIILQEKPCAH